MAKKQETHAKRARELALQEKRERKRAKKAEAAAQRASGDPAATDSGNSETEGNDGAAAEWVR
jgi:hypothetical protein